MPAGNAAGRCLTDALLPADRFNVDGRGAVTQHERAFLDGRLQLHAALGQPSERLRCQGRDPKHAEILQAGQLGLDATPPDFRRMVKAVDLYRVCLAAGADQRLVFRLANLDPEPRAAGEIAQPYIRIVRIGQAGAEGQRAVASQHGLQGMGVARQRDQPDHHPFVGLARMTRQRQLVIGVVAVVDVGDLQVRLEDGGLDGHV